LAAAEARAESAASEALGLRAQLASAAQQQAEERAAAAVATAEGANARAALLVQHQQLERQWFEARRLLENQVELLAMCKHVFVCDPESALNRIEDDAPLARPFSQRRPLG
jgi:hypothetical protein